MARSFYQYCERLVGGLRSFFVNSSVLDVGCGNGKISEYLLNEGAQEVVAGDIKHSKEWVEAEKLKLSFLIFNACHLPFRDGAFDIVFEKDVLHHISDYVKGLDEMLRCSLKGVIIVESNRHNPLSYVHLVKLCGHDHFSQQKLKRIVSNYGNDNIVLFAAREAHVYPIRSKVFLHLLRLIEDFFERISPIRQILSYNIAVIMKRNFDDIYDLRKS